MANLPDSRSRVHSNLFDDPDGGNDEDGFYEPTAEDRAWWSQALGAPEGVPACEPRLPFAELVRVKASLIRLDGSNFAHWLAGRMDRLAATAEMIDAETPDQFDDRYDAVECGIKEDIHQIGYTKGYADGKSETMELFGRG